MGLRIQQSAAGLKKPANARAWALMRKLQALAERGVDGEKESAKTKILRLESRYDFSAGSASSRGDLFSGRFQPSHTARRICQFKADELDVASSVKWAIESATGIGCLHRGEHLYAEAAPATARKLEKIAKNLQGAFSTLLSKFCSTAIGREYRNVFLMGLYDGLMSEKRPEGNALPNHSKAGSRRRGKKDAKSGGDPRAGLHVHPYTVAFGLGEQIRASAPLAQVAAELQEALRTPIGESTRVAPRLK